MLVAFHSVERLGSPFLDVNEYVTPTPPDGQGPYNTLRKIIFVRDGGPCRHEVRDGSGRLHASSDVEPGDILVVPHLCQQRYLPPVSAPMSGVRVHAVRLAFDPTVAPPLPLGHRRRASSGAGDPEMDFTAFVLHHFQEFRHLPGGQTGPIREALAQLSGEAEQRQPGYRFRVRALCVTLVTLVARQFAAPAVLSNAEPSARDGRGFHVGRAKEHILRNLDRRMTLTEIAAEVGLSEEHLARVFKRATGQTLLGFARRARLERAKSLLVGSDRNVSEIAALTGFGSVALFCRSFREYTGASPLSYRDHLSAGEQR
jgi:AraC-like DNA-binding protein